MSEQNCLYAARCKEKELRFNQICEPSRCKYAFQFAADAEKLAFERSEALRVFAILDLQILSCI